MTKPHSLSERIRQRLSVELRRYPPRSQRYYTLVLPLADFHLHRLPRLSGQWIYWSRPGEECYRLGLGEALHITAEGSKRLHTLAAAYRRLLDSWDRHDPENTGSAPLLFTGFAFAPDDPMQGDWTGLPNSSLFLPEVLLQQQGGRCTLFCSFKASTSNDERTVVERWMQLIRQVIEAMAQRSLPPGSRTTLPLTDNEPTRGAWLSQVDNAKTEIARGGLEKVVLARRIRVRAERRLEPSSLMTTLDRLYPDSSLFAIGRGVRVFTAATPELLLRCQGNCISSDALAGTAPRAADDNRDRRLGQRLLADAKSCHEHQLVVETIRNALAPICRQLSPVEPPNLKRLRGLQHLWTRLQGRLAPGYGLFEAATRLHPTAAVNGAPTAAASAWLANTESIRRGWYTGAAGWIDDRGDGELAVLIRCALLQERQATLFAGAGITAGSDTLAEYDETELKLAAMLEALEDA